MSESVSPYGQQPSGLLCPRDSLSLQTFKVLTSYGPRNTGESEACVSEKEEKETTVIPAEHCLSLGRTGGK